MDMAELVQIETSGLRGELRRDEPMRKHVSFLFATPHETGEAPDAFWHRWTSTAGFAAGFDVGFCGSFCGSFFCSRFLGR